MTYADKTFDERINDKMWNHSESRFEGLWTGPYEKYGLGEGSVDMATWKFPPFISHTPDYRAAFTPTSTPFLVEVQGTGTKAKIRTHKFKQKKLEALGKWNAISEVALWLWDDKTDSAILTSYISIRQMIQRGLAEQGTFDGKRPYWAIPVQTVWDNRDTDRLVSKYSD